MDNRQTEFRVGMVILATIVVLGILIMFFGEFPALSGNYYTIFVRFDGAPGVSVGTPVRKDGILIGRVTKVQFADELATEFDPEVEQRGVLVALRIDRNKKRVLTNRQVCQIKSNNILSGDAVLEFVQGSQPANGEPYIDGDYLEGLVASDPLQALSSVEELMKTVASLEGNVREALTSIQHAGDEVGGVARSMNAIVTNNQDQFQRIVGKAEAAMTKLEGAMGAIDDLIRDDGTQKKLRDTIDKVPIVLDEANEMMKSFRAVAVRAEKNLENIEALTEPLGQGSDAIFDKIGESLGQLDRLGDSLGNLDELITEVTQFSRSLNDPNGTIGQLVQNRELYDRLNSTVANIEVVTGQLEPVVRDARVAMDKIARNPYRLGVRGLLYRQQSGLKY